MTVLHLGVIEQPYRNAGIRRANRRRKAAMVQAMTTYDVAMILEAKYHIMRRFFEHHMVEIDNALAESYARAVHTAIMRGVTAHSVDLGAAALDKIRVAFDKFITQGEVETIGIPGVPTKAALAGVSHRRARPHVRRGRRPSFFDTGLYVGSFRAWVD